ncbi:ribonuclease Y [Spiroplasma endosymbiont of Panorpa germanica]|uniref:ribonuclease Y n=1 Tax=Spiroplasma endosymbiont of Panorpa germanica TaxID=3066314 RepID=UPI0030D30997
MNSRTAVEAIIALTVLFSLAIIAILVLCFSQRRQRLIKKAQDEAKKILISATADAKIQSDEIIFQAEKKIMEKKYEISKLETDLEKKVNEISIQEKNLELKIESLSSRETLTNNKYKEYEKKLEDVISALEIASKISQSEAKEVLFKSVEHKFTKELNSLIRNKQLEAHNNAKTNAIELIVAAMEKYAVEVVAEKTTSFIKLPTNDIKGRIIGKEGRNIKALESFGGVDVIIDETPNIITISSFNPIRREIVTRALNNLIADGRIQPVKIEEEILKQQKEIEQITLEAGTQVIEELGIFNMDIELIKLIGKLKYRTSYGQNVLLHSIEVAKLAGTIAAELGLNTKLAIRSGLLHDIGKAVDFEEEGSHVVLGINIAQKYREDKVVINSIASHHGDFAREDLIAAIVSIADSISASRPGARNNSAEDFLNRMSDIEKIAKSVEGVQNAYAIQSGRQIRIIVDPELVEDWQLVGILNNLQELITKEVVIPGEITMTIIREKREVKIIR